MNYNRLFDLLFSEVITEDVKLSVVEKVRGNINEGVAESSPLTVLLSTLVYEEEVTEGALNDIIDIVFEGMSEDEIERVLEEFKRDTVIAIMEWDPAPVGLKGVEREAAKQNQPKAIDRLKSAVGKVKNWAGNVAQKAAAGIKAGVEKAKQAVNQPTGLDKLKQVRSEMIDHAVKMGTGTKPASDKSIEKPEPPKAEAPKTEPTAAKASKAKKTAAPKAAKKVAPQPEPEAPKAEVNQPKVSKVASGKQAAKKVAAKKSLVKNAKSAVAQAVAAAEEPKKEVVPVKRGRKKVSANEALKEALKLIESTSISESSLMEITEMISNKRAAKKAVEREYKKFEKAMNSLNKAEEVKAKTGVSPVSPEQHDQMVKQAEELGNKYERVKASAERKFGKEC